MEDFYELARQVHNERKAREYDNYCEKEVKGEFIYGDFWRWCIINGKDSKNANHFAEFLKSENVTLTSLQRQTHVHRVRIQPSHPLSSPSPPAFHLSQHQSLFQ